jgi:hypothetical protein
MTPWRRVEDGALEARQFIPGKPDNVAIRYRVSYSCGNYFAYQLNPGAERGIHIGTELTESGACARCELRAANGWF